MNVPDRDPRIDPRPGDVLKGCYLTGASKRMTVKYITHYGNVVCNERGFGESWIGLPEWRKWAAGAEVVHQAETIL